MYCRGGLCLIGRSRRLSFNSIAIMPSVPKWDGSPMTEKQQPECTIESNDLSFLSSSTAFGSPSEASQARHRPERGCPWSRATSDRRYL